VACIMAYLIITDIKSSRYYNGQSIITAVIKYEVGEDLSSLLMLAKEFCRGWMILESATASEDIPSIGVQKGDFYFKVRSRSSKGLLVGDGTMLR